MQTNWLEKVVEGFALMSGWEAFAAILGLGYIILAARTSQWCWLMAFVSTLIYTLLFWEGQLPMQALLNFYYMGMAIYGYWLWRQHGNQEDNLPISSWSWRQHGAFILVGSALTALIATYLDSIGASKDPYLDAGVTVFSVMNTWLMARKVIENWLYWIFIDAAAALLYFETGYYATMVLFGVYTVLAIIGYISWVKIVLKQT
jgi:nicotinamide mononucleotide transporter